MRRRGLHHIRIGHAVDIIHGASDAVDKRADSGLHVDPGLQAAGVEELDGLAVAWLALVVVVHVHLLIWVV